MAKGESRYDGVADWYDDYVCGPAARLTDLAHEALRELLGSGPGRCLDVGCGTGASLAAVQELTWSVVGIDLSADQLRVAHRRVAGARAGLVQADASALPFEAGSFDAVVSLFTHTDVDDFAPLVAEVARVLRSGGSFVYIGTHPCFVSPFVEREGGRWVQHQGYRKAGWHDEGPGLGDGIRQRVGVRHVPLAELVDAVLSSGLTLERMLEPGTEDPPRLLALRARRPRVT